MAMRMVRVDPKNVRQCSAFQQARSRRQRTMRTVAGSLGKGAQGVRIRHECVSVGCQALFLIRNRPAMTAASVKRYIWQSPRYINQIKLHHHGSWRRSATIALVDPRVVFVCRDRCLSLPTGGCRVQGKRLARSYRQRIPSRQLPGISLPALRKQVALLVRNAC